MGLRGDRVGQRCHNLVYQACNVRLWWQFLGARPLAEILLKVFLPLCLLYFEFALHLLEGDGLENVVVLPDQFFRRLGHGLGFSHQLLILFAIVSRLVVQQLLGKFLCFLAVSTPLLLFLLEL